MKWLTELPKVPQEVVEEIELEIALGSEKFIREVIEMMGQENPNLAKHLIRGSLASLNPREFLMGAVSFYYCYKKAAEQKGKKLPLVLEETIKESLGEEKRFLDQFIRGVEGQILKEDLMEKRMEKRIEEIIEKEGGLAELLVGAEMRAGYELMSSGKESLEIPFIEGAFGVRIMLKAQMEKGPIS